MKIGDYTITKLQLLVLLIMVAGLIAGVWLVQKQQIFKSKATTELNIPAVFTVSSSQDGPEDISCSGATCTSDKEEVFIKFDPNPQDLENLKNSLP